MQGRDVGPLKTAEPFAAASQPLEVDVVASLMRRHEVAAERLIGWLRVAIGACIFVTVIAAENVLRELTGIRLELFERNAWIAAVGFLLLGAASIALADPRRWRHGFAYLFMVLDIALVLAVVYLAIGGRGLPGNAVPSAPIVWSAPLLLAVGALRYDVRI